MSDMPVDADAIALGVARAVISTPPHHAPDAAAAALGADLDAEHVALWQADYAMRLLHAVGHWPGQDRPAPMPVASPAAPPFRGQQPQIEPDVDGRHRLIVPLTVRGHRLGMVETAASGDPKTLLDAVRQAANLLAPLLIQASHGDDVYEMRRRSQRLSLPAEMQWQILPRPGLHTEAFSVYAQLEPAHLISSDAFDWSYDGQRLTVIVLDSAGEGVSAAQSTDLAMTALRNARRAPVSLVEAVSLADQALWDEYRGASVVELLLVEYDLVAHTATLVGSATPTLLRWQTGQLDVAASTTDNPLGASELTVYHPQRIRPLTEGGIDLLVTDGVLHTDPQSTAFGTPGIERILREPGVPIWEIPRLIVDAVRRYCGGALPDDASCVAVSLAGR
jgi:serine phosphatase RsbU (regulator of sigma subunit)